MDATLDGDVVRVSAPGRERFYDSRGYGRPAGDGLKLAPVEAAHLLYRGDLDAVAAGGESMGFREFLGATDCTLAFLVYKDLRDRGFYLSSTRLVGDASGGDSGGAAPGPDLVVYPRGSGPWDDAVAHRVRVLGERDPVAAGALGETLAVVDEESEITYLGVDRPDFEGASDSSLPTSVPGTLLSDRVVLWDPPAELYGGAFFGQPLDGRDAEGPLQCSLVEAAYLAERAAIDLDGGYGAVVERGRAVEGERFDRRLAVYRALRDRGTVPKTGFKFGADFRTYAAVESAEELGHSGHLVRVLPADRAVAPRDLALDVRLAHGVRKTMVFALVDRDADADRADAEAITWRAVSRLTP